MVIDLDARWLKKIHEYLINKQTAAGHSQGYYSDVSQSCLEDVILRLQSLFSFF